MHAPILSILLLLPLAGALITLLLPGDRKAALRGWATAVTGLELVAFAVALAGFDPARPGFQWVERMPWVPSLGIQYYLGVDGISLAMVGLTALIWLVAVIASYGIEERVKEYFVLLLLLEAAVMGVFESLDYVLFYVAWELVLVPMYFLIAIWGGPRREYAAMKFLLYTMVGSLLMLVGIVALYAFTGFRTFSIPEIARLAPAMVPAQWKDWIWLLLFAGFAVKVPIWPFHTWLPDAHVEAPTPISVVLAAILLKLGLYGFLRISDPTLPEAARHFALLFGILGVINILYAAFAALAQKDMKRVVAYSSISHMGFAVLGIAAGTPLSVNGAVFVMVSHGLVAAMLFLMVGVFYDRTHSRDMDRVHGMYEATPVAATFMAFAAFANLGLPFLSGFVGEFFTLAGTIGVYPTQVFLAALGLVMVAAFNLMLMHRVLMGKPHEEHRGLPDLSGREAVSMLPLMAFTLLLGVLPATLVHLTNPSALHFVRLLASLGGGL